MQYRNNFISSKIIYIDSFFHTIKNPKPPEAEGGWPGCICPQNESPRIHCKTLRC